MARLVTPVETALGAMVDANGSQGKTTWFDPSRRESVTRFCAHLRGGSGYYDERTGELKRFAGRSPAIDAGDPSYSFALEPDCAQGWHGRRVNLGAYGNTPYATMSYFPGAVLRVR